MPARRSLVVKLSIPSDKLAVISPMRVVATGLKRPRWKKGEKEQMYALRQQKSDMPIKEFTEKYYPNRTSKALDCILREVEKKHLAIREHEMANTVHDTVMAKPSDSPTAPAKRLLNNASNANNVNKRSFFMYSDDDGDDDYEESSSEERIEDITPSGNRTPNKYIKLARSTEPARLPSENHENPPISIVQSNTSDVPQNSERISSHSPRLSKTTLPRPSTVPVAPCLGARAGILDTSQISNEVPSPGMIDKSQEDHSNKLQVAFIQEAQQGQDLEDNTKQPLCLKALIRQNFAKTTTNMFTELQTLHQLQESTFSLICQIETDLQSKHDKMESEQTLQIEQLQKRNKILEAERDTLLCENTRLSKNEKMMKDVLDQMKW